MSTSDSVLRKRRGVTRASLSRLATRLRDLESKAEQPGTLDLARRLEQKLEELKSNFMTHHLALVDVLTDEDVLATEQGILDDHDEEVTQLEVRVHHLITACSLSSNSDTRRVASKRLTRLHKGLAEINDSLSSDAGDVCKIHQHQEQLADFKTELGEVRNSLLSLDLGDEDELNGLQSEVERGIFDVSLKLKRLLQSLSSTATESKGIKLPKLEVPTFDGDILTWRTFWEQFCVSVHDRSDLSDSEKLVYLRSALKGGSAKQTIEGLSRSGEHYAEAVECLRSRYDRPRLIHQTHVKMILEAPPLREGNGKELRKLHDTVQQHLRALKAMDYEPSGPFITSVLELKLDTTTMFEWQKFSHDFGEVPHYHKLLEFINLRAQASETSVSESSKKSRSDVGSIKKSTKPIASFAGTAEPLINCIVCNTSKHPLYACPRFKAMTHENKFSTLKSHKLCLNCLRPGHFVKQCKSMHRCQRCQKPHHTLLHVETKGEVPGSSPAVDPPTTPISTHATVGIKSNLLLMTCRVVVVSPEGRSIEARALLDSASSTSFISQRLVNYLRLPCSQQNAKISGVAGLTHALAPQSVVKFAIRPVQSPTKWLDVTAVVTPRVTCHLPLRPVPFSPKWNHLSGISLADPNFGSPARIDLLLGVDIFVDVLRSGKRSGPPDAPIALETDFGWVLAGSAGPCSATYHVTHHVSLLTGDDILRKFWELEEKPMTDAAMSPEERSVVRFFEAHHSRADSGNFIIPLPRKQGADPLGESRSQAVRRFLSLERTLHARGQFKELDIVMKEYFSMGHAEQIPAAGVQKRADNTVFYLPIHAVRKESSTTTKVRAVFDASAKSSTGVSLNDTLLIGPTVHPTLIDVLIRFRLHRVALTTDVSRMYRAVLLTLPDRDLHRFVWRSDPNHTLQDYRMTRLTFGVNASSFIANMSVKQNARDHAMEYPLASKVVDESFYVDDGLTGADSVEGAVKLQCELQNLFGKGGFTLRKWNSSDPRVLQHIPPELRNSQSTHCIPDPDEYIKALGIEWNAHQDCFRFTVSKLPSLSIMTKRNLVSDIAKLFDVLGFFSPTVILMKILLQRLWQLKLGWDDTVPPQVHETWSQWRSELKLISERHIDRCYFPKTANITLMQLHGFSDASERAYAGVVYLRMSDSEGGVHVALVMSKIKVAPIKRVTIPRLELCGAHLLAQMLHRVKEVLHLPLSAVFAWTDSTIVINWLSGNFRRFKTYVGNRVSHIVDLISPDRWRHVNGVENPADCASRGVLPSELIDHPLWWTGPEWLRLDPLEWPQQAELPPNPPAVEADEVCLHSMAVAREPVVPFDRYSSFTRLLRITTRILRFIRNCSACLKGHPRVSGCLTVTELKQAELHLMLAAQTFSFDLEMKALIGGRQIPRSSCLISLRPFLDSSGLLRVGGREQHAVLPFNRRHPIILHGNHLLTRLIIHCEHLRLLHAGPTLLMSSLFQRFHIVGGRKMVRSITRGCATCRRLTATPQPPAMGQLPMERVTPDVVFERVGVDYAGPVYVKHGYLRKPTIVKAYICIFVSLSVKAVHLELVSDLTTEAFIASLRRFISRRGKPTIIWSDHGTNFVGASRELRELVGFLNKQMSMKVISDFCSTQSIQWDFIPEHAPHFGGLWEAAVKSTKLHLRRVVGEVKLTFEELTTVLTQIEACLNSRPLVPLPSSEEGFDALTPGHFLIGRPLESLPDPSSSYRSLSLIRRWNLCQALVRHFWKRWSTEYLVTLQKVAKWHQPRKNLSIGDLVVLREDNTTPTRWPLARVSRIHPGKDGTVRVITLKTPTGLYTRPVTKVVPLFYNQ